MGDPGFDLWLVGRLARESLENGTLRGYWPGLSAHRSGGGTLTVWVARLVYVALAPIVPLVAARRRRLIARALEGVVRAVVSGVEVPTALEGAVAWLERKGLDPLHARTDLERLLAGFLATRAEAPEASPAPARDGTDIRSAG